MVVKKDNVNLNELSFGKANPNTDRSSFLVLGSVNDIHFTIPYKFLNRHGIIAGTTGSGKSRAMQVLAEQLANNAVNVFVSDLKGDSSGFCKPAEETKEYLDRNKHAPFSAAGIRTNYWSIGKRFIPLRFSLTELGATLISRFLSLNSTQESSLSVIFNFAKKRKLDSFEDLLEFLNLISKNKDPQINQNNLGISSSTLNVMRRKILAMQDSGIFDLFGFPSLNVADLKGLNVLNLSNMRKDLLCTLAPAFLLQKLFNELPEEGDVQKPKYAIFFDEAHYLFKGANRSLVDLIITILKQIRSKGVSVFFVTQDVTDIPEEILSQLSTKIIFAQRTLTQKGNNRLKALSRSFPKTNIDLDEKFKTLPPGYAIASTLDANGNLTSPKEVKIFAPGTSMSVVSDKELLSATDGRLVTKYTKSNVENPKYPQSIETYVGEQVPELKFPNPTKKEKTEIDKESRIKSSTTASNRPDYLGGFLSSIQKIIFWIVHTLGYILDIIIIKPLKKFIKWLTKKPIRILWFILFLLILYFVYINWSLISLYLEKLKIS